MSAAQDTNAARSPFGTASAAASHSDAARAHWLTAGRERQDLRDAARAGAESADLVVRAKLDAGMTAEQIHASAERVLGDRFTTRLRSVTRSTMPTTPRPRPTWPTCATWPPSPTTSRRADQ